MEYRTNDFESPSGHMMIYGVYDEETKIVSFRFSKGYFYPQDSQNTIHAENAEEFIKNHTIAVSSLEEANSFLQTLAIKESYNKGEISYEVLMFVQSTRL
jgi:hypothetical protein